MASINFFGKNCLNLRFYQPIYSNKNQVTEKQEFSPKINSCTNLKRPKKEVSTLIFMNRDGS